MLIKCIRSNFIRFYIYIYYYSWDENQCNHYGIKNTCLRYRDLKKILKYYKKLYLDFLIKNNVLTNKIKIYLFLNLLKLNIKGILKELLI